MGFSIQSGMIKFHFQNLMTSLNRVLDGDCLVYVVHNALISMQKVTKTSQGHSMLLCGPMPMRATTETTTELTCFCMYLFEYTRLCASRVHE